MLARFYGRLRSRRVHIERAVASSLILNDSDVAKSQRWNQCFNQPWLLLHPSNISVQTLEKIVRSYVALEQ